MWRSRGGDVLLKVYDSLGRLVKNQEFTDLRGRNLERIDLEESPVGAYFIHIRKGDWQEHKMILKTK
jgi:hypothetical protein